MIWFMAVVAPGKGVFQALVLVVAWTHACLGLWMWMRIRPWYPRVAPYAFAFALLLPALAIMGFVAAARDVTHLVRQPGWTEALIAAANFPDSTATLDTIRRRIVDGFAAAVALTLLARWIRQFRAWRSGRFRIAYPDGREVAVPLGLSILEASQLSGIPHASVCGGRGRCSTCRVRVTAGLEALPSPSPQETAVLARAGAGADVRLACQLRPKADVAVVPLLPAGVGPRAAWPRASHLEGQEKEIVILFADLRGFTALSQHRLPYDVVFILNRYFNAMGRAIETHGGHVDKFIGDGVMALFGVDDGPARGAQHALAAARAMGEALAVLNRSLSSGLERELKLGIGIHMGPAIVGEMGYGRAVSLTAIGDAVNTASRLEQLTKDFAAELVVSESVARAAGVDLSAFPTHEAAVRGREGTIAVRALARASDLPEGAMAA
jgi:adenylate cyclase